MKKLRRPIIVCCISLFMFGCGTPPGDPELTRRTILELVDWHVAGLMMINCPVAWVRVANYNSVPIKNIIMEYKTFDVDGTLLSQGTAPIEETVRPGAVRNFIEQYLGLVDLHSERLQVKLLSVERGD